MPSGLTHGSLGNSSRDYVYLFDRDLQVSAQLQTLPVQTTQLKRQKEVTRRTDMCESLATRGLPGCPVHAVSISKSQSADVHAKHGSSPIQLGETTISQATRATGFIRLVGSWLVAIRSFRTFPIQRLSDAASANGFNDDRVSLLICPRCESTVTWLNLGSDGTLPISPSAPLQIGHYFPDRDPDLCHLHFSASANHVCPQFGRH